MDFGPAVNGLLELVDEWRNEGTYPLFPIVDQPRLTTARFDGAHYVTVFGSADYLGLGRHPDILEAAKSAIQEFGTNSYGVQPVGGFTVLHQELEEAVAGFFGWESALLFPTGMQANMGVIAGLMGPQDTVFTDQLNHGSITMGIQLSGAQLRTFRHNDTGHLAEELRKTPADGKKLIVVDGLFSADGDFAPLVEIADLASEFGALLMVDEAHSGGAVGKQGRGAAEQLGILGRVDIISGTMSKAFVSTGGFVCAAPRVIDAVRHTAGAYLMSLGLAPPTVAASLAALRVIEREGQQRREQLQRNAARLRDGLSGVGLDIGASEAHVVLVHLGGMERTLRAARELSERGLFVGPLAPPAVPIGGARLRLGVSAAHTEREIDTAVATLGAVLAS